MSDKAPPKDESRRELIKWLWRTPVIAVAGGASFAAYEFYKVHFTKGKASKSPEFTDGPKEMIIAATDIDNEWDSFNFVYQSTPAMIINISEEIAGGASTNNKHFIAFSRICTHQGCIVDMNKNIEAMASLFNYRPKHPEITCHCHFSIFNPLSGAEVISGPAQKPLPRIRLEHDQGILYATGIEIT